MKMTSRSLNKQKRKKRKRKNRCFLHLLLATFVHFCVCKCMLICSSFQSELCSFLHNLLKSCLFTSSLLPNFLKGSLYSWEWPSDSCYLYKCSDESIAFQQQGANRGSKPPFQPFSFQTISAALKHSLQSDPWFT